MTDKAGWMSLFCDDGKGDALLPMLSGSMAPQLLPGDSIMVRPIDGARAHRGDIIVFRDGNRLVAHRLVFAARFGPLALLIEKGDANYSASRVRQEAIVGIVVEAQREGRAVLGGPVESRKAGRGAAARSLARLGSLASLRELKRRIRRREA